MADIITKTCSTGGESYSGNGQTYDSTCADCQHAEEAALLSAHFAELDKLTTEERSRRIEEWMYNHRRVKHGYILAPRF